jgi:hypothetical protein
MQGLMRGEAYIVAVDALREWGLNGRWCELGSPASAFYAALPPKLLHVVLNWQRDSVQDFTQEVLCLVRLCLRAAKNTDPIAAGHPDGK